MIKHIGPVACFCGDTNHRSHFLFNFINRFIKCFHTSLKARFDELSSYVTLYQNRVEPVELSAIQKLSSRT